MDLSQSDWKYVDERAAAFVGREWVFARVRSFLSGPPGTFLLRGDPGTGKTAVAARIAQASCGRLNEADSPPPVGARVISAGVFCRAGKATVPELAQRLSDQLAASVDGFADALRATAEPGIAIRDVHVDVQGDVHAGGIVSGVTLPRQDGKQAFSTGVAVPLRHLRARGAAQPIVLLVDAVDEAVDVGEVNTISRLLANLDGVHLIVTCRPDPSVLYDFRAAEHKLDLISDGPADDDVRGYIRNRLQGHGPEAAIGALIGRVAEEAAGNFLYAFYVTGTLIESGSLAGMDEKMARGLPLPTGGLSGVYEDLLDRQIAGDETRWAGELRPVLAPLCVALGDGLTTVQLAAIASRLTGRDFSLTEAGDVTRAAGQFLDGPRPSGPFRVYHQSFSRFLTDPGQNPNWPIDLTETDRAVVRGLSDTVREDQPGARDWAAASHYVRRHLATHAAAAGVLDDLLGDPGYLLAAYPPALLAVLDKAHSPAARRASAAYRRVAHRLADPAEPARGSYLRLAALQAGAADLLTAPGTGTGQRRQGPGWFPAWAWWRPATASRVVGELPSSATALAAVVTEHGPLAVAGGEFGLQTWDLEAGQQLAAHPWKVLSLAVGLVAGRPVVLAGHNDGIVTLHGLPSLEILARNNAAHTGDVLAAVILTGGSTAATGDKVGTLVLWQLPAPDALATLPKAHTLETLATRPKAHSMVRALADATGGGFPLLISAGDTFEPGHRRSPGTEPVRTWTLPGLRLHSDVETIETTGELCEIAVTATTPLGCIVMYRKGSEIAVKLIAADGGIKLIGTQDMEWYPNDLLVLEEGGEPQILVVGSGTLTLLRITLQPVSALTLGAQVEAERHNACWAGPVDVTGRPFLVSATSTLRAWDLGEIFTAPQQDNLPDNQEEHYVSALAIAGDALAALTSSGSVHRWRWPSAEAMEPLAVRSEHIQTLAGCTLADRPHIAIAYSDGVVESFDASTGERWPTRIEIGAALQTMAIGKHADRTVAATAVQLGVKPQSSWDKGSPFYGVRLWDLTTGTEIPTRSPDGILAIRRLKGQNPDDDPYTWKLTIGGYADKQLQNLVAVETADDLFIAASIYERLEVWPLNAINEIRPGFNIREESWNGFGLLAGQDGLLATARTHSQWDLLRLGNGGSEKSRGEHPGVAALVIGSWQDAPAVISGGEDGSLRVWSQGGAPILSVDVGEPVTALAFLPEGRIAAGTPRGVVVFQLTDTSIQRGSGPLEAKLAGLRAAAPEQDSFYWDWRNWRRRDTFPPATPGFHRGPAREIAQLITESPAETFQALSSWLEDDTPLTSSNECTVADVACTLMGSYSPLAFDELCDVLADLPGTTGAESKKPFWLLQTLMVIAPDAGASVCERWSTEDAEHAQLATVCAHQMLQRDPPPDLRARLLAAETRVLNRAPTPLARTEALHTLAEWPETRDQVIGELADRFLGRAEGYASASTLSKALATHFDLVLEAFQQKLMRDPARYEYAELSAPADYVPATDTQAIKILNLYRKLWEAGPGEPMWAIVRSLLTFATHTTHARGPAVALAITAAHDTGDSGAREVVAEAAFYDSYDSELRQQIVEAITGSTDQEMKGALAAELAESVRRGPSSPDEKLSERILQAAADQLEAHDMLLLRAAQESRPFASALARVVQQTTPQPGRLLSTFAEQTRSHTNPQTAAVQAIEIRLHRRSGSS